MKKILSLFALSFALAAAPFAYAGNFGGVKTVSDPVVDGQFPEIAYFNGVIHVVWVGFPAATPGQGHVYYSRSTVATGSFSAPMDLGGSTNVDRAHVTAGASGVVVGWNTDGQTGAIYARRSGDGGLSFAGQQTLHGAENDGLYSRLTGLFTDSGGRVHASFYTNADTVPAGVAGHIHHRMSCDGGQTWSTDVQVTSQSLDGDADNEQPRVGEAGGRYWLTFRSSRNGNPQGGWPPYSIILQSGTLSACQVNWTYPGRRVAGGVPFTLASTYRPEVFGDSGGILHVTWWENTFGANAHYRKGTPSVGLGAPAMISSFNANHLEPGGLGNTGGYQQPNSITSNGTTAFVAYSQFTQVASSSRENGPVLLEESADNGTTWGAPQTVAPSGAGNNPRMALDNANTQNVGIVWTDFGSGNAQVKYRLYTLGALSGGPSLSISPDPAAFGNQQVYVPSGNIVMTVLNSGTAGTISGVAKGTSGNPIDFDLVGTTCGGAIGAGASCTITMRCNAQALGARTTTIVVSSNAVDSPNSATLTCTGVNGGNFTNNVNAVVTGYYETILGRVPDSGGKTFWVNEAGRVVTLGASVREVFFTLSLTFFTSAEYTVKNTDDNTYVRDLYRTFFIREPDPAGQAFWVSYLTQGVDRNAVLINFLFSPEFNAFMTNLFGPANVRPEIDMTMDFFRGILGRLPDDGGFNFWLGQLRAAQCQGPAAVTAKTAELADTFATSGEYGNRELARQASDRNRMYIGDLYNAFLRRGAEPSGYNFWTGQLNSAAQTRQQVRTAYVNSPEFQNRVSNVAAQTCIP